MGFHLRDWAGLPSELLLIVLDKVASYREYRSFPQVCKSWLSVVREREEEEAIALRPLLLLMIPYLDDEIPIWLLRNALIDCKYRLWLTSCDFKRLCGSSNGWLIFADEDDILVLFNPWSRRTIPLPPIHPAASKVVLSGDPDVAKDCVVAAIYSHTRNLAFTKLGRSSWTYVDRSLDLFSDVLFNSDRLVAVDLRGRLMSVAYTRMDLPSTTEIMS
ncbi:hypothetical protein MLD38_019879 [Melastoma candidum]|uniref:Uncharacterized protein n=1 Tax=Melastoma candidum TaxID=119954 RepID=A0ACB9QAT8_9MYRT|nr:hypothetical protein MLD38_019879 [Melastoma candidum]